MIRKFLKCRNNEERFEFFAHSFDFQWSEGELDTLYEILSMQEPKKKLSSQEKYEEIFRALKEKKAA